MTKERKLIIWLVIAGNIIFICWILYNGIREGFRGTLPEKISYLALIILLATNAFLLNKTKVK